MIEIPGGFARQVIDREGDAGRAWVRSLPGLVDRYLRRWRCTPNGRVTGGVGIVLDVRREDGSPAVLKISYPHPGNQHEAYALATWGGQGAVRLYERDDDHLAMLLEQAERRTLDELADLDHATEVLGRLAQRLAVPAPPSMPRLADRVETWEHQLRADDHRLGSPLPRRTLDTAVATVTELGQDQPDTMVHGDLHFGNVVATHREPWLVIDPKGLAGDPAYDALTVLARGVDSLRTATNPGTEMRRRLTIFADAAEIDRERAIRWAHAHTVRGAHHSRTTGDPPWLIHLYDHAANTLV